MNRNERNTTMRKYILSALLLSAAFPAVAHAATLQDVWATAGSSRIHSANRVDAGIAAGSAPIEQALATLIPAPYRIELDSRVPNNWIVVWTAGQDWLSVLRAAVEPMGLRVVPEWSRGEIKIVMAQPKPAPESSMPASVPPFRASSATTIALPTPNDGVPANYAHADATHANTNGLIQIGEPGPGEAGLARPGRGVPLTVALGLLVPKSWASNTSGVNPGALVSWGGDQSWPQALAQIAVSNGWTMVLDWTGHTVTVEGGLAVQAAGGVSAARKAEPPVAPIAQEVVLLPGESLSKQMVDQGKAHGWSVIWKLPQDWIVPNKAMFSSDFPKAAQEIVRDLAANGADIGADVYQGNRTVVVHSGLSK